MTKLLADFKAFAVKGNVIDMAVGVIIGAAFGKIVTSLVNDLIMPPIGWILGKTDFKSLFIALDGQKYLSIEDARKAVPPAPILAYGNFLQTLLDFVIVAFVIFITLKKLLPLIIKEKPAVAPTTKDCPECLSKIPLGAKRCAHCAIVLPT